MKNKMIYKLFFAVILFLGFVSCEDREMITVENTVAPVVMDLSTDALVLDENFPTNHALTVNWEPAEQTVPVELKYILEVSKDEAFTTPVELGRTAQSVRFLSYTVKQLNETAKLIGLLPNEPQNMYFRVKSYLGEGVMEQVSNVTKLLITPYVSSPTYTYTDLYLIGNSTPAGWDNSVGNMNLIPLLKNPTSSSKYSYTGLFKASVADAGFKIIKDKGSWDAQYGYGEPGVLSSDGGSGNLTVPADGYYKLEIDLAAMTYSLTAVTPPTTTFDTVSIIGNGNDWNTDIQLTQSSFDPHLWIGTSIHLKEGEIKFRANNAWDVSWGTDSEFFGTAVLGGSNIPVSSEWDYHVYFNDISGDYTLIPVK